MAMPFFNQPANVLLPACWNCAVVTKPTAVLTNYANIVHATYAGSLLSAL